MARPSEPPPPMHVLGLAMDVRRGRRSRNKRVSLVAMTMWVLGENGNVLPTLVKALCVGVIGLAFSSAAIAQTAVDGDTLRIGALTIRLFGIDAPEMKQVCGDWPAG